jgi:hypothetical protein
MVQATPTFSRSELLSFAKAVANIIAADRKITEEERSRLTELVGDLGLSMTDGEVEQAIGSQLSSPSPIESVVKDIKSPVLRRNLYRTLIEVALSDGLAPQEEEKLAAAAKAMGLNAAAAKELVQWTLKHIELEKQEDAILQRL